MKLHLVSLPHTQVSPAFCGCAYTGKVLKFIRALGSDHEIVLYAPEGPAVEGATLVPCFSQAERVATFGLDDPNNMPKWPTTEQCDVFNRNVAAALKDNVGLRDLVLLSGGLTHLLITQLVPNVQYCEPFIGYEGILGGCSWGAYESHTHMSRVYALRQINDIRWFDCVIPPFADENEFPVVNDGKGDYLLFLGRLVMRKGPQIALEIAKACGLPLYVAGAGATEGKDGLIVAGDLRLEGNVKYIGPVNVTQRAGLIAGARAVLMPTLYQEPGGNVAIEAMMCGTPVIAPDFGVFSETIKHGQAGFLFRTFAEAIHGVKHSHHLDPEAIRHYAMSRFSLKPVAAQYTYWFHLLGTLFDKGWYQ